MNHPRTSARGLAPALAALALTAAALLPATALATPGHAAGYPAGIKVCGSFSGPHWAYKGAGGTQYIVYTRHSAACPFALSWAPRLVTKRPHGAGYAISGGPTGWVCSNSTVHFGICVLKINGHPAASSKSFAWAGKTTQELVSRVASERPPL